MDYSSNIISEKIAPMLLPAVFIVFVIGEGVLFWKYYQRVGDSSEKGFSFRRNARRIFNAFSFITAGACDFFTYRLVSNVDGEGLLPLIMAPVYLIKLLGVGIMLSIVYSLGEKKIDYNARIKSYLYIGVSVVINILFSLVMLTVAREVGSLAPGGKLAPIIIVNLIVYAIQALAVYLETEETE
ncbi:MAG: hypothetical protein IKF64_03540 [Eubacterium sp.]|nr:hypothetical protein [Eubacterium sp.]